MRRSLAPAIATALTLPLVVLAGGAPPTAAVDVDHDALDRILADVVRGELVDYRRLAERHLDELERYLERLATVPVDSLARDAQLAFYINLYNATVLREVVRRLEPDFTVERDSFALFKRPLVRLRDRTLTLDDVEHRIVRPGFDEPRIHVALVCAARSCPPLPPRAWRAADLDATLEAGMRRFLNDGVRNRVDVAGRTLRLSSLFDWYADDFGGAAGRVAYVDRYLDADVTGFDVEFLDYDWTLNIVPPDGG